MKINFLRVYIGSALVYNKIKNFKTTVEKTMKPIKTRKRPACKFCGIPLKNSKEFCSYYCSRDYNELQLDESHSRYYY